MEYHLDICIARENYNFYLETCKGSPSISQNPLEDKGSSEAYKRTQVPTPTFVGNQ